MLLEIYKYVVWRHSSFFLAIELLYDYVGGEIEIYIFFECVVALKEK
jgi:hypothetical protein